MTSVEQSDGVAPRPPESVLGGPAAAELLERCIHCGLCLPACPTYAVFHHEMDGPRGRIALMRGVAEGRIGAEGAFSRHIDLCVGCLSCETACPSGVRYGELLEMAQQTAESVRRRGLVARLLRWLVLRQLLPHRRRLRLLAALLRLANAVGLVALGRSRLAPEPIRRLAALAPAANARQATPGKRPAGGASATRPRLALFTGCVQEAFFGHVNRATEHLLERGGYEVVRPSGQTCCGALAMHAGERELARDLARRNVDAFASERWEAVVTNAGGCGAMLESYPRLFADDDGVGRYARRLAERVRDVSELLLDAPGGPPRGRFERSVVYADSCHLRHGQGVVTAPRRLLAALAGIELVELEHPERCCGSGGAYSLLEGATADRILALETDQIAASGAQVVVSSNPGCQLQLELGARRQGLDVEVLHLVEVLERAVAEAAPHGDEVR